MVGGGHFILHGNQNKKDSAEMTSVSDPFRNPLDSYSLYSYGSFLTALNNGSGSPSLLVKIIMLLLVE